MNWAGSTGYAVETNKHSRGSADCGRCVALREPVATERAEPRHYRPAGAPKPRRASEQAENPSSEVADTRAKPADRSDQYANANADQHCGRNFQEANQHPA